MAEKKKTTPKKKTTVKKKTTPKKTVRKAKSTAKKVTKKASTTAKKAVKKTASTAKKKTTTAKKAVKKTAKRVLPQTPVSVLSFADWKTLVGKTFDVFPALWWRIGVINLIAMALVLATVTGAFAVLMFMTGGNLAALENEIANLVLGSPDLGFLWSMGGLFILLMTVVFLISFITNIAALLTFKNNRGKKSNNPFSVFFGQSWSFLGRYTGMTFRVFWYVIWPVLLTFLAVIATTIGVDAFGGIAEISTAIGFLGLLVGLSLLFWRSIRALFAYAALIQSNKAVAPTFEKAIALVKGHWWLVLWGLALFFVPMIIIQGLLDPELLSLTPLPEMISPGIFIAGASLISVLLSLFVFAPLSISFVYLLMLHLSKTKKIKL